MRLLDIDQPLEKFTLESFRSTLIERSIDMPLHESEAIFLCSAAHTRVWSMHAPHGNARAVVEARASAHRRSKLL